jgi:hypothetical protein
LTPGTDTLDGTRIPTSSGLSTPTGDYNVFGNTTTVTTLDKSGKLIDETTIADKTDIGNRSYSDVIVKSDTNNLTGKVTTTTYGTFTNGSITKQTVTIPLDVKVTDSSGKIDQFATDWENFKAGLTSLGNRIFNTSSSISP